METYFTRQIQLWGEAIQTALKDKTIAILGCGGLGGNLALTLGGSGIGKIHLVDFDTVSIHNIHRQLIFTLEDEGRQKCECAKKLVKARYDGVNAVSHNMRLEKFLAENPKLDLILDATDNLPSRAKIDEYAKQSGTPWVYASVEAWHGQVCFMKNSSFADAFTVTDRKPSGIAAPIVAMVAGFQANLALRFLTAQSVESDVLHYLSFDANGSFGVQKFKMPVA